MFLRVYLIAWLRFVVTIGPLFWVVALALCYVDEYNTNLCDGS